jgi:hypothetical protein
MPKQAGQEMVASFEPQYLHLGAPVEVAAPHMGQFSVSACIDCVF